jgi:hypothetical protein
VWKRGCGVKHTPRGAVYGGSHWKNSPAFGLGEELLNIAKEGNPIEREIAGVCGCFILSCAVTTTCLLYCSSVVSTKTESAVVPTASFFFSLPFFSSVGTEITGFRNISEISDFLSEIFKRNLNSKSNSVKIHIYHS